MGLLSHRVERSEIELGDHIYTWRTGFTYSHHGIYIGGEKVVHFTQEKDVDLSGGFIVTSCSPSQVSTFDFSSSCTNQLPTCSSMPDCGFKKPESGVVLSCLDCFLGRGSLYRFEYGISLLTFLMKPRGGTCTTAKSDTPETVIHRAMYLLHNGFGKYNVFENNCEDFALYCKTGLLLKNNQESPGRSGQVYGILGAPLAAFLSAPLRLFMSSPVGMATAGVSLYCLSRYAIDIGVRNDVIKVEVEDVLSHGFERQKESTKINECPEVSLSLDQTAIEAVMRTENEDKNKVTPKVISAPQTSNSKRPVGHYWEVREGKQAEVDLSTLNTKPVSCNFCGKKNHEENDCWKKCKKCIICGGANHKAKNCQKKNKTCFICREVEDVVLSHGFERQKESTKINECPEVSLSLDQTAIEAVMRTENKDKSKVTPKVISAPQTSNSKRPVGHYWKVREGKQARVDSSTSNTKPVSCNFCGKKNHEENDCWKKCKKCIICGGANHKAKNCQKKNKRCFICRETSHLGKDCPKPPRNRQAGDIA